jgi:hypothetical protein
MGSKCEEDLDSELPRGVEGNISVKRVTNMGASTDCHVDCDDYFINLEIINHVNIECAVRYDIRIEDENVEFQNYNGFNYSEFILLQPASNYNNKLDKRLEIDENAPKFQTDSINLNMKVELMELNNSPRVDETVDVDVN